MENRCYDEIIRTRKLERTGCYYHIVHTHAAELNQARANTQRTTQAHKHTHTHTHTYAHARTHARTHRDQVFFEASEEVSLALLFSGGGGGGALLLGELLHSKHISSLVQFRVYICRESVQNMSK